MSCASTHFSLGHLHGACLYNGGALQKAVPCVWWQHLVLSKGHDAFGYDSWESLWADYTVFATVRNIYDRAGSAYDYLLMLREVCIPAAASRNSSANLALHTCRVTAPTTCMPITFPHIVHAYPVTLGVWSGFFRSALLLAVSLCWVDCFFQSWVLLGLLCFLPVKRMSAHIGMLELMHML